MASASLPTIRRLPLYLRILKDFAAEGKAVVSCTQIAEKLGFESIQVRKDLSATGIIGKPKVGYEIPLLQRAIESFLGWNDATNAFVVGAGSLATAFLGYQGFKDYGLNILAAFDTDPKKIGGRLHGKEVFPIERIFDLAERLNVRLALLTVPADAAQKAAELCVYAGIRAILNFSPVRLNLPETILVENVDLAVSLATLSSRLADLMRSGGQGSERESTDLAAQADPSEKDM